MVTKKSKEGSKSPSKKSSARDEAGDKKKVKKNKNKKSSKDVTPNTSTLGPKNNGDSDRRADGSVIPIPVPGSRRKSNYEQAIGEQLPDWEFPKTGAMNVKEVERMSKKMDLNAPGQADLLGVEMGPNFGKPKQNQHQGARKSIVAGQNVQHYTEEEKKKLKGVYNIHPDNNKGFDLDSFGNSMNIDVKESSKLKEAGRSGKNLKRKGTTSPRKKNGDNTPRDGDYDSEDSDMESYDKSLNEVEMNSSDDSGESGDSQIVGSQKSINQ